MSEVDKGNGSKAEVKFTRVVDLQNRIFGVENRSRTRKADKSLDGADHAVRVGYHVQIPGDAPLPEIIEPICELAVMYINQHSANNIALYGDKPENELSDTEFDALDGTITAVSWETITSILEKSEGGRGRSSLAPEYTIVASKIKESKSRAGAALEFSDGSKVTPSNVKKLEASGNDALVKALERARKELAKVDDSLAGV